jgi:hypothetical protein
VEVFRQISTNKATCTGYNDKFVFVHRVVVFYPEVRGQPPTHQDLRLGEQHEVSFAIDWNKQP